MDSLKKALFPHCYEQLERKQEGFSYALLNLESDRSSETKSSAGDKYETSREMMQQEMDKLVARIRAVESDKQTLQNLQEFKASSHVSLGSLIKTDKGIFWLAISMGRVQFQDEIEVMVISPESPIGNALMHKKVGDIISVSGNQFQILEIA